MKRYEVEVCFKGQIEGKCSLIVFADSEEDALERSEKINLCDSYGVEITRDESSVYCSDIIGVIE